METPNWTKDELVAYISLYAANSNLIESNKERDVILSKVDMTTFQKVYSEFQDDNDYQSIQKIIKSLEQHNYTKDDIQALLAEIKLLFYADSEFDTMEQNMMLFLKKIFRSFE
ncbi:MAG: hypothetical protein KJO96_11800 [Winogradskyella sp.]|nr:hypothetical protein [Winogradskyella sp.]